MKKFILIIIFAGLLFSCQKAKDCLTGAGKEVIIESPVSDFDSLFVNDVFEVHLIQDTVNYITIKANKAFAESTTFKITDNTLILENNHKCKFSKPKKNKIKIYLQVKKISRIRLNAPSKLISDNVLQHDNEIGLIADSKFNEADLDLNCKTFYYWNTHLNGGKINLHGEVENLKLWHSSLCSVDADNLSVENVLVDTDSNADSYIRVKNKLDCTIRGNGNVYYYGNPDILIVNDTTSIGKLIFLGE